MLGIVIIHPLLSNPFYCENKILYYLITSSSITVSAQIATLPITLYIFHSFPTYFIFANLILVPWSSLILYLGIAFLFTSGIPFIGTLITFCLNIVTSSMNAFIHLIHLLPHAQLTEINFNFEQVIIVYLFLSSALFFVFSKWNKALHLSGLLAVLFIFQCYKTPSPFSTVLTYYQSNLMLVGTEKELILACNNDTLAKQYVNKIKLWKCQQNRASQTITYAHFPRYFMWKKDQDTNSFATFHYREKSNYLLLNEEMKAHFIDSAFLNEIQHKRILVGQGISRKKKEFLTSSLNEKGIPFQKLQSHPFNLK